MVYYTPLIQEAHLKEKSIVFEKEIKK